MTTSAADEREDEELIERAARGDPAARDALLDRHRERLRTMVAIRMDHRLAARVDPSDVVQESLAEAACHLADYLQRRPLPFYPWLRQIAREQLIMLHRRHLHAERRSVTREQRWEPPRSLSLSLSDDSIRLLGDRLAASGTTPSRHLARAEIRERLTAALARLPERDREVLVLRHLEQLKVSAIAAVLGTSEGAVMTRHTRALEKLRRLLDDASWE
jgi:RNA polymerase sigma-70 factor (ECF subfamily)